MTFLGSVLSTFLVTLLVTASTFAEGPCKADKERLCPNIEAGKGAVARCLKDNADQVSEACKASWAETKSQLKDIKEACQADAQKLCSDKQGKQKRKCLRDNRDKLSEACRNEIKELREKRKGN